MLDLMAAAAHVRDEDGMAMGSIILGTVERRLRICEELQSAPGIILFRHATIDSNLLVCVDL